MPLTQESMMIFDDVLEYYNWPIHNDNTLLAKLEKQENFNPSNYKSAVSCYRNWCAIIYPSMVDENKDEYKLALAQQTLNILHAYAPNHHIHKALSKQ